MPENNKISDLTYTQNRELSWLRFNERVLDEAADETVPLMERLRFISIFTSNLDEFFMVRVGSLYDLHVMDSRKRDNKSGMTSTEQLAAIFAAVRPLMAKRDEIYRNVSKLLSEARVRDIPYSELTDENKKFVQTYYKENVKPLLSPQIIDRNHPFPHLKNKLLYIAAILKDKDSETETVAIVPVPESVPSIIKIPNGGTTFVRMETIIEAHLPKIFKKHTIVESSIICVTRNADISFDEDKFDEERPDFRSHMSKLLKQRDRLNPVRLEMQTKTARLQKYLTTVLNLSDNQCYLSSCPLNLGYSYALDDCTADLYYKRHVPAVPAYLNKEVPLYEQIRQRDVLMFYPYHSFEPFTDMLKYAAHEPSVVSIKITIYRLAKKSKVAKYLLQAAENGKEVTVLMELRARFDERFNIEWAKSLEEAGCNIIYGPENYKCHSKICLITRKEKTGLSHVVQLGTGNYNEKTSELYTDFSLMSSKPELTDDAIRFFQNMLIGDLNGTYKNLLVAPHGMKPEIMQMIEREIKKGENGRIIIKANSVTERELMDKLSEASCAGVKIDLITRGICCIRPEVLGKTENIRVTSIVGRFLEHSRIYCFGQDEDIKIYISSADIMTRNQERRVEIACPILSDEHIKWFKGHLDLLLADNVKARRMNADGTYRKVEDASEKINSQRYYIEHSPEFESFIKQKKESKFKRIIRAVKEVLASE